MTSPPSLLLTTLTFLYYMTPRPLQNAEVTGGSLLGGLGPKTREPDPTHCKRKQLFAAEEGEYGERARKRARIEQ